MESLKTVSKLEIPTNQILYDKSSKIFSVEIFGFIFVGHYKKSIKISKVLDDIYASLKEIKFERENLCFLDEYNLPVSETVKLKNLLLKRIKVPEKKEDTKIDDLDIDVVEKKRERSAKKKGKMKKKEKASDYGPSKISTKMRRSEGMKRDLEEYGDDMEEFEEEIEEYEKEISTEDILSTSSAGSAPPAPGGGAPSAPSAPSPAEESAPPPPPPPSMDRMRSEVVPEKPELIKYNINMGFQYYSVMMEKKSYLFYVYLSHKKLIIADEEGKTIYKTTVEIVTTKKEPPILELRIEGEGFEAHPLTGKVVVKKDAVNPPVMIFSVLPLKYKKGKTKKRKEKSERRYLNVYVDFENKTISHTVLSIIVQPKHYHLDIGPIQLDISKRVAMLVSLISVLFAIISTIYSAFTFETPSATEIISGYAPGLASFIFFAIFIITLVKNGIYPLKQKWSAFLNLDEGTALIK